jgi:flagellar hook-length control protein FliK
VQQQLNALETNHMMWQGNIWPGQDMKWEVHEQAAQNPAVEGQRQWVTQIQLDLPNLGAVAATLRLNSAGLSLSLNADTPQTRAVLGNASTRLVSSLADAGIPVLSTQITNEPQNTQP